LHGNIIVFERSLASLYPEIALQWHPILNGEVSPSDILPNSNNKYWWICDNGHKYDQSIASRTRGRGCPYCSGRKITFDNNLEYLYPKVAKEWHPTNNGEIKPSMVFPKSSKKFWWKCSKGHEWYSDIASRTGNKNKKGTKCPECQGRKVGKDNNLAVVNPRLAEEWHPTRNGKFTPYDFTSGSKKKVWWICNRGHEWLARIQQRNRGRGCPHCSPQSSRLEIRILSEMKPIFGNVEWRKKIKGLECDVYIPEYNIGIETDGFRWHQGYEKRDKEKEFQLKEFGVLLYRVRDNRLKPVSENEIFFRRGESHLRIIRRFLRKLVQNKDISNSHKNGIVRCLEENRFQNEEEYNTLLASFPSPQLTESIVIKAPELLLEWNYEKNKPLKPEMFSYGSSKKVWWICTDGHEWESAISSRVKGHGCPACAGKIPTSENNLENAFPEIAKEWHPTRNEDKNPADFTPRSGIKVWWICEKGHEWEQTIHNRTSGSGCPGCYKENRTENFMKSILKKRGSLADNYPELIKEWHPSKNGSLKPSQVTSRNNRKVWWICEKGHEYDTAISNRTNGSGCPYCTGKRVGKDNNLAVINPSLVKDWHPIKNGTITPYDVTPGSNKKVWWQCPNNSNHIWETSIYSRVKGSGCPICAKKKRVESLKKYRRTLAR
jgi:hypothetical protein